jgi:hypothetical protein
VSDGVTKPNMSSAREQSRCTADCQIGLKYNGVADHFNSWTLTHNGAEIKVEVGVGTSIVDTYNALARALVEVAGHV